MLAEVLETYTPEERYSMSTFLDGVESYFGYETRKAISLDSTIHDGNLVLNELHLYGSSRLGMMQMQDTLFHYTAMRMYDLGSTHTPLYSTATITQPTLFDSVFVHQRGSKVYEGTNHLGNVLVTYTDKRLTECQEDTIYRYVADVKSQTDYSAFGILLEERQWYSNSDTNSAIYGFNGMRKDNEIYGSGNAYDFGARIYDSRRGQWASVDPKHNKYPSMAPYLYVGGNPILFIDPNGEDLYISGKLDVALNDIRSLVPEDYRSMIRISDDNQIVFDGYADLPDEIKQYEGVSLLNKLINSKNNYQYAVGDEVLAQERVGYDETNPGKPGEKVLLYTTPDRNIEDVRFSITNLSVTPRTDLDDGGRLPDDCFHGSIRISEGTFYQRNPDTGTGRYEYSRNNVVFHELLENYLRTDKGLDYDGRYGAHKISASKANKFSKEVNKKRDFNGGYATDFEPVVD